jgi:phosphatidylserine/phosphatidylglycerophosphate/cardiolipin synthase-like enzyme
MPASISNSTSRLLALGLAVFFVTSPAFASQPASATVRVYFSPRGGCEDAVVHALDNAQNSVHVQAYSFTNKRIAAALVAARKRGVAVSVMLDKSQRTQKYSSADFVAHAGIPTSIDARHAIAHNKIMIIDGHTIITGSFNFTVAAETSNAENLLVIRSAELAETYLANWKSHRAHAEAYAGR